MLPMFAHLQLWLSGGILQYVAGSLAQRNREARAVQLIQRGDAEPG
jgi:hypothetical protein